MVIMETVLSKEGQATLDAILARRAPLIRPRWNEKILRFLSLLMLEKGAVEAGKTLVLEAAKFVTSAGFTPYFDRIENEDKYRQGREWKHDRDIYYKVPREVKRWPSTVTKPAKPPQEMKVLAINASPRKNGNTEVLIQEAMRATADLGADTEMIRLQKLKIGYCIGCRKCKRPGYEKICSINDDMTEIYGKIKACDAVIVGFPIYTGRESAQLSTFLDRLDCFRRYDQHEDRITPTRMLNPGQRRSMVIGTWGYARVDTYDHIVEKIATLLNGHRLEPMEAISASGFAGLLKGFDDDGKAMILRYPDELEKAYQAGRALITGIQ
jgi:putative NADPH-quinone reductase